MALTKEERNKIIEEETLRNEVREELNGKNKNDIKSGAESIYFEYMVFAPGLVIVLGFIYLAYS